MNVSPQSATAQQFALVLESAAVPLVFLILGVLARRLGRRDGDDSPRPNDWAAATNILLMSLGKVAGDLIEAIRKGNDTDALQIASWLLGLLFAIFVSIDRDRYASWVIIEGKPSRDRKFWVGTVFPNMVAVLIFTAYEYVKLKKGAP